MSVRQLAWRALYEVLAARVQRPEWAFMNYGYAVPPGADGPALSPADEPDRLCIQLYDHVLRDADLRGADVLEVGCGRGGGSSFIARDRRPRTTTGLDLSRKSIALCRKHRRAPGLSFVQGDALAMPFADGSFDVVVNVESSHCYDSMDDFLAEVHRVLRPGGSFRFADLRSAPEMAELRRRLGEGPLELIETSDITERVRAALDVDDDRRRSLMEAWIPRMFHRAFAPFAGFRGSSTFAAFESGEMQYVSARLVKSATV
ncbi:class I SAM-dependent methyltransferase [Agrococcus citreus]|uniref:Phthiotriol/phenolphthiotriol dimycocerosates methyltransferase n=1 Tax=Agrococcus citreus TaxID=84643 RepID=A0ABP4JIY1_9MICO